MTSSTLMVRRDHRDYELLMVVAGFLAGYTGNTRLAYQQDLREFDSWCHGEDLWLLDVRRAHIELFARYQETLGRARATITRRLSTISSFYRYCVEEQLILRSPALNVRRPKLRAESTMTGLDRNELEHSWSKPIYPTRAITPLPFYWHSTDSGFRSTRR